ncbi:hypothetical protein VNO80_19239 [Phaseolus coccineus]|uniref:Uncharacterized protein n=1 Tax=Phaseolus coccineus TaxID=3886 RepID=A0AAN9MG30_PHACN
MGSNNSRLNGKGGEVLPARVRSRIEELRRKIEKKELNFDGSVDGGKSQYYEENYGGDSNKGSLNDIRKDKHVEKVSKVVPLPVCEPGKQHNELYNEEKWRDVGKKDENVKSAWLQQGNATYGSDDEEDEDEDDDDIESGRNIGPSSPSFKIYCIESKNKEEEFPESKDLADDENQLQKSPNDNSMKNFVLASAGNTGNSKEMLQIVKIKSASSRKGKMKEAMKKNLLFVKHMNRKKPPMLVCTSTVDGRHLLTYH